jgi:hypothetical protein
MSHHFRMKLAVDALQHLQRPQQVLSKSASSIQVLPVHQAEVSSRFRFARHVAHALSVLTVTVTAPGQPPVVCGGLRRRRTPSQLDTGSTACSSWSWRGSIRLASSAPSGTART